MTPSAEMRLYQTDRAGWLAHVAPRRAAQMAAMDGDALNRAWTELPRDYQCAVWAKLPESERARLRGLRKAA
ncbi:MAG: hypothetical protein ACTHMO_12530 [Rhodanobacteraceae bacterium]